MKKRVYILQIILGIALFLPTVSAEISLQGPGKSVLNIGDEALMSGYILTTKDTLALFKLMLACSSEQQLLVKTISLKANVKKDFSENIIIPSYYEGSCVIRAVVESGGTILDQASSPTFTISKDLSGTFSLDKEIIKLGDPITISASMTKLDGTPLTGIATITFKQAGTDVLVDSIPLKNGALAYTYTTKENPAGQYTIEITAQDVYGNTKTFQAGAFSIISDVTVFAEPDSLHYDPGKKIKIKGEATILDQPLEDASATATLGSVTGQGDVSNGAFSLSLEIPSTITSGTHTITTTIEDDAGNRGSTTISIIIDPKPTTLTIIPHQEQYLPGNVVKLTPVLKDQAGAVIATDIALIISNPKGKEVFTDTIPSNSEYEFHLMEHALPGAWKVKAFAMGLEQKTSVLVGEHVILDYLLLNSTLFITNNGNIRFSGPIKIEYIGLNKKFSLVKEFSLDANETIPFNIAEGIEPGTYDITIDNKLFENITIENGSWSTEEILTVVLAAILLILVLALVLYIKNWKNHKKKRLPHKESRFDQGKKIVAAHHPKSDDHHVSLFKQKMATETESAKKKIKMKIRKGEQGDYYIYEIPKKKERPPEQPRQRSHWTSSEEPPGWREPEHWSNRYEEDRRQEYKYGESSYQEPAPSSYREESSYASTNEEKQEQEDITEKKKGLFNMFD